MNLQKIRKAIAAYIAQPIVRVLAKTPVTPNMVTWAGFIIILAAAVLAGSGHPFAAGWVMLLSGCFDFLDGALARNTNRVTRFGGILDSTLDRISEAVILLGVMGYFIYYGEPFQPWTAVLIGGTITSSFMVSYIRSRAEAAGIDCQVGISTRPERVILLALGLLLSSLDYALIGALGIITLLSTVTVVQRLAHVYRKAAEIK